MITAVLAALIAQAGSDDDLQRIGERMGGSANSLNRAAGRENEGRGRLNSIDKSIEEQAEALKLIDGLLEELGKCPSCKKKGG